MDDRKITRIIGRSIGTVIILIQAWKYFTDTLNENLNIEKVVLAVSLLLFIDPFQIKSIIKKYTNDKNSN